MIGSLNSIEATAEKLSIPQLQQAMRDGTLPSYVGMPILQKKAQLQKQMQLAQAGQQGRAPTVAEQVNKEADEASVHDMMKARALAMQGDMGQTGGISDFLPKPKKEETYAEGGVLAFAEGTYGKTIAEQLEELYGKQKAAQYLSDYGWTPEAVGEYSSAYKPNMRQNMSRRGVVPVSQPMSLDELRQARARAKAQTGLGIRDPNTIEMPPYKEPVTIKPSTGLQPAQTRAVGAPPYTPEPTQLPVRYDKLTGEYIPVERPGVAGLLPKEGKVVQGASFEIPSSTPRADAAYAQAEYAERAANRGYRPMSKEAADFTAEEMARDAKWARADQLAKEGPIGPRRPMSLGSAFIPDSALVQQLSMPGITGFDYEHPELGGKLQSLMGMNKAAPPESQQPEAIRQPAPAASAPVPTPSAVLLGPEVKPKLPVGSDQRDLAARMQLGAPRAQIDEVPPSPPAPQPAPAGIETLPQAKSSADYIKEMQDTVGENKYTSELKDYLAKQDAERAHEKERAPWLALMQAGLATIAGTSPFALANIGAGGVRGMQSYAENMKDLQHEQRKADEIQLKLAQAQREEDMALAKYGSESVRYDKAEKAKERLLDKELQSRQDIATLNNATDVARANIMADKQAKNMGMTDNQIAQMNDESAKAAQKIIDNDRKLSHLSREEIAPIFQKLYNEQRALRMPQVQTQAPSNRFKYDASSKSLVP